MSGDTDRRSAATIEEDWKGTMADPVDHPPHRMTLDTDLDRTRLWAAVDAITKPTTTRVYRNPDPDEPDVWASFPEHLCAHAHTAATVSHGTIPSLWDQAVDALTTGTEAPDGNRSPQATRTPADLDLMETMLTIRESMAWQLKGRAVKPREGIQAQMRQLAAYVAGHEPDHIGWWAYRFAQWARVLAVHVQAVDQGPRPVRLRNTPCPKCAAKHVTVTTEQGDVIAPPILIDFVNGWIRAAQCTACGAAWWRGQDLWDLAAHEATPDATRPDPTDVAEPA